MCILATQRFFKCPECGLIDSAQRMFDSLAKFVDGDISKCKKCGKEMKLHLHFPFKLGASEWKCVVKDAFLPREKIMWKDGEKNVEFCPFLVVLLTEDSSVDTAPTKVWLPYWHITNDKNGEQQKAGQWAPNMDISAFEDLVSQAKEKGYLKF
jgi:hypothetical protein